MASLLTGSVSLREELAGSASVRERRLHIPWLTGNLTAAAAAADQVGACRKGARAKAKEPGRAPEPAPAAASATAFRRGREAPRSRPMACNCSSEGPKSARMASPGASDTWPRRSFLMQKSGPASQPRPAPGSSRRRQRQVPERRAIRIYSAVAVPQQTAVDRFARKPQGCGCGALHLHQRQAEKSSQPLGPGGASHAFTVNPTEMRRMCPSACVRRRRGR